MEKKRWHAIYTRPRWEKKVHSLLKEKGFDSYCPINRVQRKWSDRIKTIEEPLFKSYVFVKISEAEKSSVRMVSGVVNFVYWLGKPALIRDREIENIKKFLSEYKVLEVKPVSIAVNSKVKIDQGLFMDKEATVIKVMKKRVELRIDSIGYTLIASLDRSNVSVLPPKTVKTKKISGND